MMIDRLYELMARAIVRGENHFSIGASDLAYFLPHLTLRWTENVHPAGPQLVDMKFENFKVTLREGD